MIHEGHEGTRMEKAWCTFVPFVDPFWMPWNNR